MINDVKKASKMNDVLVKYEVLFFFWSGGSKASKADQSIALE